MCKYYVGFLFLLWTNNGLPLQGQGVAYYPYLQPQGSLNDLLSTPHHHLTTAAGGSIYSVGPPSSVSCSGSITLQHNQPSYILSPRYPDNYPPNFHCAWHIKVPFGSRIVMYFEELLLPSSSDNLVNCNGDHILVQDLHLTHRFCYYNFGGFYMSVAPSMLVHFHSDGVVEEYPSRFRIRLESNTNWCGGEVDASEALSLQAGDITSPNYPRPYAPNVICSWRIKGPSRSRIALNCLAHFWLEQSADCSNDFLAVSISGDETMKDSHRFCGFNGPGRLVSDSNVLTLLFHSNSQLVSNGFRCQYEIQVLSYSSALIPDNTMSNAVLTTSIYPNLFPGYANYPSQVLPQTARSQTCDCGKANTKSLREVRIVGGSQTPVNAYPWVVAIFKQDGRQYCAGSLINELFVLTASHCVAQLSPNDIYASLGDHDLELSEEAPHSMNKVKRILIHPGYKSTPVETDDIALLQLSLPAHLNDHIRPVCLPPPNLDLKGQVPTVVGWGKLSEAGQSTSILRETTLPILPNSECQRAYGFSVVTENMICAGQLDGSKDACQGDSGGPMMVERQSRWYVIGLVSYGFGCARPDFPGVYTRIDRYLDWIRLNTEHIDFVCSAVPPSKPPAPSSSFNQMSYLGKASPWKLGRTNSHSNFSSANLTSQNKFIEEIIRSMRS